MHPAYSVILFTTLSGAGYGLLAWLACARLWDAIAPTLANGIAGMGTALALITIGLLTSTAHLGHPERAWRALSQWRTSWLSREGVAAVVTYVPAGLLGLDWLFGGGSPMLTAVLAIASIAGALITVWCTGMIYASLRTIARWNHPLTAPGYLLMAMASGGVLYALFEAMFARSSLFTVMLMIAGLLIVTLLKLAYWQTADRNSGRFNRADALGMERTASVRNLDDPHARPNFVQREMGYRVGRKHAATLRLLAGAGLGLITPALLLLGITSGGVMAIVLMLLAVLTCMGALFVERWLFFAEAEHVSGLYYRNATA